MIYRLLDLICRLSRWYMDLNQLKTEQGTPLRLNWWKYWFRIQDSISVLNAIWAAGNLNIPVTFSFLSTQWRKLTCFCLESTIHNKNGNRFHILNHFHIFMKKSTLIDNKYILIPMNSFIIFLYSIYDWGKPGFSFLSQTCIYWLHLAH